MTTKFSGGVLSYICLLSIELIKRSGVKIWQTEQYIPLTIPRNTPRIVRLNIDRGRLLKKEIYKNSGGYLLTLVAL